MLFLGTDGAIRPGLPTWPTPCLKAVRAGHIVSSESFAPRGARCAHAMEKWVFVSRAIYLPK